MKTEIISLADRLRASGRKEGMEKSKKLMISKMLLKNADIDFICEVAEVPKLYVLKIQRDILRNN